MVKGLPKEVCKRCGHTWVKRVLKPKVCPKCRSPYWDTEPIRRKQIGDEGEEAQP